MLKEVQRESRKEDDFVDIAENMKKEKRSLGWELSKPLEIWKKLGMWPWSSKTALRKRTDLGKRS